MPIISPFFFWYIVIFIPLPCVVSDSLRGVEICNCDMIKRAMFDKFRVLCTIFFLLFCHD